VDPGAAYLGKLGEKNLKEDRIVSKELVKQ
jgi:hypothetical protein